MTEPTPTVIFIHIPKTAGSTFKQILRQKFDEQAIFTVSYPHDAQQLMDASSEEKATIQCIVGHCRYGIHHHLSQPSTYITMLRDPIERVISEYYYLMREPSHGLHEQIKSGDLSLLDFVCMTDARPTNEHVRRLSGYFGLLEQAPFDPLPDEALLIAKENLKREFSLIGLTEKFDESILLLRRAFNLKGGYYRRVNVTSNRPRAENLPTEVIEAIHQYEALDIELYEYAKSLFQEKLDSQSESFYDELLDFRRKNRRYAALKQQFSQMPGPVQKALKKIRHLLRF